jgi:hypothetical protein
MEIINNFSDIFFSVWKQGILGVDIFQILIGIGIFFIFLVFRGLISKLIIKKLEIISKRTTNKLDDTFVHALVGPARFLPIVLGFFIASYYMTFSIEGREVVDTINRTLITILIFWVIHQIIEPISYILSGLDKLLTRELMLKIPDMVYIYSQNSASSFLNFIKINQSESLWMNTNLMCIGEKTSSILNEIKWKKIFLFNPGEEEFLLYKI